MDETRGLNEYFLYINSKDRNLTHEDETTFHFKTQLNSFNTAGAVINNSNIKSNIVKIELLSIIIPNFYLDLKSTHFLFKSGLITSSKASNTNSTHIRTPTLNSLQYICVNMDLDSFNNSHLVSGTNTALDNSTFIMTHEDRNILTKNNSGSYNVNDVNIYEVGNINNSILADTYQSLLFFKRIGNMSVPFTGSMLNNLQLSIIDQFGHPLRYLNDSLVISKIIYDQSNKPNRIYLEFKEYFSPEEYPLGDLLSIHNLRIEDLGDSSTQTWASKLVSFLNDSNNIHKHTIVGHKGDDDNVSIGELASKPTRLFKGLYIALDHGYSSVNETSPDNIFSVNNLGFTSGISTTVELSNTNNRVINLNKQILFTLKITTK